MELSQENLTSENSTAPIPKYEQISVIVPLAVNGAMLLWMLWLVISILVYGMRTNRFRRRSAHDFNGGIVFTFAFLSALLLSIRLILTILMIAVPPYYPDSGPHCGIIYDITIVSYTAALVPIYLLLWLRQRVLYSHPTMSGLHGKGMVFLSWGSIGFLVGAACILTVMFTYRDNFVNGYYGCIETGVSSTLPNIFMAIVLVIGQIMLLGLFIIPLRTQGLAVRSAPSVNRRRFSTRFLDTMKRARAGVNKSVVYHTRASSNANNEILSSGRVIEAQTSSFDGKPTVGFGNATSPAVPRLTQKKKRSVDRIRRILWRSVCFGALCMASDLATLISTTFGIKRSEPRNIPFMIYDISLFVNVMCIIFSFDNYKAMMFAPCFGASKVKNTVTELSSRQHSAGSEN